MDDGIQYYPWQTIVALETHITHCNTNHCATLIGIKTETNVWHHWNIFKWDYYYIAKDASIYFIDYHLEYFQPKFIRIYGSISSSIVVINIWNIFKWIITFKQ